MLQMFQFVINYNSTSAFSFQLMCALSLYVLIFCNCWLFTETLYKHYFISKLLWFIVPRSHPTTLPIIKSIITSQSTWMAHLETIQKKFIYEFESQQGWCNKEKASKGGSSLPWLLFKATETPCFTAVQSFLLGMNRAKELQAY
jgi:hypothetical protein